MFFFFFKQKTAYEMRISDWSSDVCSSDLARRRWQRLGEQPGRAGHDLAELHEGGAEHYEAVDGAVGGGPRRAAALASQDPLGQRPHDAEREHGVGEGPAPHLAETALHERRRPHLECPGRGPAWAATPGRRPAHPP